MSKIEWTHRPGTKSEVLNPTTGCDKESRGCKFCYAEIMHKRLTGMGQPKYQQPFLGHVQFWPDELAKPFRWKKPRTVFLNSMSDIFHKDITVVQIAQIYAMIFLTQWHTYIVLTKRADRACVVLNSSEFWEAFVEAVNNLPDAHKSPWGANVWTSEELEERWPLKNVWQGVSVENQDTADLRIPFLLQTDAHIRVVSYEPAIGPVNFNRINIDIPTEIEGYRYKEVDCLDKYFQRDTPFKGAINWVIAGGESGHNASPSHPDWFRTVRDQCEAAGVAFFFKQWGEYMPVDKNHATEDNEIVFTNKGREVIMAEASISQVMAKVGKKESGNLLDGKQHLNYPL